MRLLERPQRARGDRPTATTLRVWGLWALSAMPVSQLLLGRIRETLVEAAGSAQETARRSQPPAAVRIPKSLSLGREGRNSSLLLILAKVLLPVGTVLPTLPWGCNWLCPKWRQAGTWLWAGGCVPRPQLSSCVFTTVCSTCLSPSVDTGQLFCGNALRDTQVCRSRASTPTGSGMCGSHAARLSMRHLDPSCSPLQPRHGVSTVFYLQTHHEGLSGNTGAAAGAPDLALGPERAIHAWHHCDHLLALGLLMTILLARLAHDSRMSTTQAFWRCRPTALIQELPFMGSHSVSRALNTLLRKVRKPNPRE